MAVGRVTRLTSQPTSLHDLVFTSTTSGRGCTLAPSLQESGIDPSGSLRPLSVVPSFLLLWGLFPYPFFGAKYLVCRGLWHIRIEKRSYSPTIIIVPPRPKKKKAKYNGLAGEKSTHTHTPTHLEYVHVHPGIGWHVVLRGLRRSSYVLSAAQSQEYHRDIYIECTYRAKTLGL